MHKQSNPSLAQSKQLNETFKFYSKLDNMEELEIYPDFKVLLDSALFYCFNNPQGFEQLKGIVDVHIDQTGDDDLLFELQDLFEEIIQYFKEKQT